MLSSIFVAYNIFSSTSSIMSKLLSSKCICVKPLTVSGFRNLVYWDKICKIELVNCWWQNAGGGRQFWMRLFRIRSPMLDEAKQDEAAHDEEVNPGRDWNTKGPNHKPWSQFQTWPQFDLSTCTCSMTNLIPLWEKTSTFSWQIKNILMNVRGEEKTKVHFTAAKVFYSSGFFSTVSPDSTTLDWPASIS